MESLKTILLSAPDAQIDLSVRPILNRWDAEPSALQILELLDACIRWGAASGFIVSTLQIMLNAAMKAEGVTLDELLPFATWRKD